MQHFVIIDGLSFLFRAYHGVRPLHRVDGLQTNALYGFSQMLLKVISDLKPDLCAVALDSIGPTFRKEMYPAYKAHRSEMDEEMKQQMPYFEPLIEAFGIPGIRVEGVEADDVIATFVAQYGANYKITIVSSDKDLMQLLGGNVTMLDTMKSRTFGPQEVIEKFGVGPEKVIDAQALIGDSSDNVPGVKSVGPKTAAQLIEQFGGLDDLYANLADVARDKLRVSLEENKENAYISRKLVTLKKDVDLDACQLNGGVSKDLLLFDPDFKDAVAFLESLEFNALAKRLQKVRDKYHETGTEKTDTQAHPQHSLKNKENTSQTAYETVTTATQFENLIKQLEGASVVAVDTETNSLNAMQADLVGISLSIKPGTGVYIPLTYSPPQADLWGEEGQKSVDILPKETVLKQLTPLLSKPSLTKVFHNGKYDWHVLKNAGVTLETFDDTMLMSFVLDGGKHGHGMDNLAELHLGVSTVKFQDVCGTGKNQLTFDQVPLDVATNYAAEDADITLRLYQFFSQRLKEKGMEKVQALYEKVEKPLLPTLARMEHEGVMVDQSRLARLSDEFQKSMDVHMAKVHKLAEEEFNLNSPKQVAEVLFDKLGVTVKGKRPTSTNVAVLEKIAEEGEGIGKKIAEEMIAYRQVAKLRSTYTEALMETVNPKTNRVHTSYNPAGAATGRFSSSDPNLQNIPIRTENGRRIRRAFVPKEGCVMLAADYSQIELRLLAHASGCAPLKQAFAEGADIHSRTAALVFGVDDQTVDRDMRRMAKVINFGLIYGMGAASMARQAGVSLSEAKEHIAKYFKQYEGVREYMDKNVEFARAHGYVETLFGRRVHLREINSSHGGLKAGAERAAINAPLQGSNADIIKMAMPKLEEALLAEGLKAKMLLQVHDELVFEVPQKEVDTATPIIKKVMEKIVTLDVPLKVDVGVGADWEEAH